VHQLRSRLPLAIALVVAVAAIPFSTGAASAGTDYAAACNTRLRAAPSLTAATLETVGAGIVVTTEGTVTGDAWTANCPGPVAGNTWYAISAVSGVSTQARYGVPLVFAATGLFGPPPISPVPTPTPLPTLSPLPTPTPTPGATPIPPPSVYVEGIDVSKYQGTIDWTQVAGSGKRFAIMRATLGTTYVDPMYATNHVGAKTAGLQVAAYHFATPSSAPGDAVLEADWFVQNAALQPGDLVPALDIEQSGGLSVANLQAWVGAWLAEVYARLGVRPMVYTSPNFWKNSLGDTTMFADQGYGVLWVAHWFVSSPTIPANGWGGRGWTFWQYDDCGSVPGIGGCVDLDRYNGTDLSPVAFGYAPPPANPAPVLASILPATVVTSAAPQTITLSGASFASGVSTAYWNGTPIPTTFVSPTTLTAVVPPQPATGIAMVTVVNGPPGGGSSSPAPVTIAIPPAQVAVTASTGVTTWGGSVAFSVAIAGAAVGDGAGANRAVTLQGQVNATEWRDITTGTTDATGHATFAYRPAQDSQFQAVFAGAPDLGPGTSQPVRIGVRQLVILRPTNAGSVKSLPAGSKVTFTATVRPVGTGVPASVTFTFWRLVNRTWTRVATRTAAADASGRAKTTWTFSPRGQWYVRAIANPTTLNSNSTWSPVERYSIR
jgi:GH25 family lysozyme M1 (1,4-beta-N-acetylmuramidase)